MNYMLTNFAFGNGPYSRMIDLGLTINERMEEDIPLIVPLIYGEDQIKIISEICEQINKPELIQLDEKLGSILHDLLYQGDDYQNHLHYFLEHYDEVEERFRDYLSNTLTTRSLHGEWSKINGSDIKFEISHNPRIATGFGKSYYTSIGFFSEILHRSIDEENLNFDTALLEDARSLARYIEKDKTMYFIPEPSVFSFDENREKLNNEIYTPPFIHPPSIKYELIDDGVYLYVSGIEGIDVVIDDLNNFGMQIYSSTSQENVSNFIIRKPEFVSNPHVKFQIARSGWSTVWNSLLSHTPLITPCYNKGDDPEIYFNEKTIKKYELATLFLPNLSTVDILTKAKKTSFRIDSILTNLMQRYGTLDGIDYTANIIVGDLNGKDVSKYKEIKPIFHN